MTYAQAAPIAPPAPPSRPPTVLALVGTAVAAALAAVVGAVLVFAGGRDLATTNLNEAMDKLLPDMGLPEGMSTEDVKGLSGLLWDAAIDERMATLVARAGFALFFAAWLLIFGLCALKAATWARVLITVGAVLALLPHLLIISDYSPASVSATSWAAMALGLIALVLCWLPPNNRYAKARKVRY
ncbi:hypothetical protein [Amycolatopsis anabasis]|uniref:hypothetical protein n=1 Tax=Amycolatopsis anabasis TaxID=1840409 RepID=UPI001FE8635A|nr:hypothetical protein [Amycolatopsis anabasis]